MLWCRSCGSALAFTQPHLPLANYRYDPEVLRWNITMECAECMVGRPIGPDSSKNHDRALYYLITYGIVRIEFWKAYKPSWLAYMTIHMTTGGHENTARQIAGKAVQGIKGLWVASHTQEEGYMISHLKTVSEPCFPGYCKIVQRELAVQQDAQETEQRSKVSPPEGLFPNPHRIPQVH